ncbi:MAG: PilT/PilU family type 4a pilus ATPase [Lachnospiraceae bacterium]|nr:PilT/PilU family type 4a pilus ATPase [Lachnospiraceae bacterium]
MTSDELKNDLKGWLRGALEQKASDVFFVVGREITYKTGGVITKAGEKKLLPEDTEKYIDAIYEISGRTFDYRSDGDDDFSVSIPDVGRFRVNVFRQRGTWSTVMRAVSFNLPPVETMNIPQTVLDIANLKKGLVLVTGTAGSGKSTTLTYVIDRINKNRDCHILTLEDPIEYLHRHDRSIVSQREVEIDTHSYAKALRAAMREAPDVILIGEMRDLETMEAAMTAAETGHLVLSTLHTLGAANTIDRVIDVFPPNQQQQIRVQLSMVLQTIVSQQLCPTIDKKVAPAFEIMQVNSAIKTLIRDGKVHQIDSVISSSAKDGMRSMDASLLDLFKSGLITADTAINCSINQEAMIRNVGTR